jgi:beta-glucanase (GH16 family)
MHSAVVGLIGLLLAAVANPQPSRVTVTPEGLSAEFDGSGLDRRVFRTCHWWAKRGCTIATNDELEWYTPEQVVVRDGRVRLVAQRRSAQGQPFVSGMISTGPGPDDDAGFTFTYGRAELRARIPRGAGLWPAFWLLPADRESKPEIDVMEHTTDRPGTLQMHLHYRDGDDEEQSLGREWDGLTPGWHRFGVDWRPGRLTWLLDGHERWTVRGPMVPDEPMYLIANLAVDGDPAPTARTPLPAAFVLDWIRVRR